MSLIVFLVENKLVAQGLLRGNMSLLVSSHLKNVPGEAFKTDDAEGAPGRPPGLLICDVAPRRPPPAAWGCRKGEITANKREQGFSTILLTPLAPLFNRKHHTDML